MGKQGFKPRRFTRDIMVVALVVAGLVIGIVAYMASQVRRDISERYIFDATRRATEEFHAMQRSIVASMGLVREWGESGLVSLEKPNGLRELLLPIFGKEKLLSGISIADTDGRSYFILPDGTERKPDEADGYDPRKRPWFSSALETDGVYWTEQYLFHTLQQVGVSASSAYSPGKGKGRAVVAFDVLLPDLYREIQKMAPSVNSKVFVFRSDELLLLPESGAVNSSFVSMGSVTNKLIRDAHGSWRGGRKARHEVISLLHEGKVWWCGFEPLEAGRENVWIAVMVPESDIVDDIGRRHAFLWVFGLVVVLVAVGGAFWLMGRVNRSLGDVDALNAEDSVDSIHALIAKGENRAVEFKSTLRMNLHSKKPGKEIELAWLKGVAAFLNTDGGTLLLGVTDDGEITGLERDVFENEDKCRLHFKNLIATHIGAEMSKYIRFTLVPVDGKTVGVVQCTRSSEPVFLKNGNKEAFHIRNGPSSDELPVSKALKYIKQRK